MSKLTLAELDARYQDYFSVEHQININIRPMLTALPTMEQLQDHIPEAFLLSSQSSDLNMSALRSLNKLGELATELAHYLQQQAQKIDLLLHYVLRQQDIAEQRFYSVSYGGSGCCYHADSPIEVEQALEVKLFLSNNEGAVFCYGQVLSCQKIAQTWQIKVVFTRIREQDRELIVRASLHQQSKLLKQQAQQRQLSSS
ncbi:PilZ domain-containing protein [Rheinheimera sp. MMS21-TC3]|uniref:PilZ domain-containing protein n=1 Tax=Rheinheimera sp. MMS21-TC3 TaxID=3072790 RepID=UPI0028C434F0|nr:PilZ domain-containing protein [Rheinheimera sp. MMS21-TC3]WNO61204.1 PilZ domain-containing protein [Rheinheimera sp. MMS21-TC3]